MPLISAQGITYQVIKSEVDWNATGVGITEINEVVLFISDPCWNTNYVSVTLGCNTVPATLFQLGDTVFYIFSVV